MVAEHKRVETNPIDMLSMMLLISCMLLRSVEARAVFNFDLLMVLVGLQFDVCIPGCATVSGCSPAVELDVSTVECA